MTASVPYTFSNGGTNTADANQVNANFAALVSYLNGLSIPTTPVTIANGGTGATTAKGAQTDLGLGAGTIIPCTASTSGSGTIAITATTGAGAPTVSSYQDGLALWFQMPGGALSASEFTVSYLPNGGSAFAAIPLYDAGQQNLITATTANQKMLVVYSASAGVFCLVNTPPSAFSAARFAQFLQSSSTQTWVCPSGVTSGYITACAPGGAGGGAQGISKSGGGGGGAGDSTIKYLVGLTPAATYNINVGLSGTGSAGAAGGNGAGPTNFIAASSGTTLVGLSPGVGGTAGTSTSAAPGGAQGGSGGSNGREGFFSSAGTLSVGGAGGDCLLGKGGTPAFDGQNGQNGQGFGSGGAGASGGTGGNTTGGGGGPGYLLIEW